MAVALERHLAHFAAPGAQGFVFAAPAGGTLDPSTFRDRCWLPALAAAGPDRLRVHDPRHTTAALAIAAVADVKVL